jgi:hypothetical protein
MYVGAGGRQEERAHRLFGLRDSERKGETTLSPSCEIKKRYGHQVLERK